MQWLQARLAQPGSRQVPLLLRLDTLEDQKHLLEEESKPQSLLRYLATEVTRIPGNGSDVKRQVQALSRYLEQGRITLLIDGLDHAISGDSIPGLLFKLLSTTWKKCPVWISGRPYAFKQAWDLFEDDPAWQFVYVAPLRAADIRYYLAAQVEPDESDRSSVDWYVAVPDEGRELLATPRLLDLMAGIMAEEVAKAKAKGSDPWQAVEALDLPTKADVYRLAYFEPSATGSREKIRA